MATSFMDRARKSFNILLDRQYEVPRIPVQDRVTSSAPSSMGTRIAYDNAKAVLAPIMTRISIDVAAVPIRHIVVDELDRYVSTKKSELNDRLSIRANIDQSGVAMIQNAVLTMLDDGSCGMVPVEVNKNPNGQVVDIMSMRVGSITQWFNRSVEMLIWNEITGDYTTKILPKDYVGIAYNPLYHVMNEPNSTLRRLIDRLAILDVADGKILSPQLDLIIQLPYVLKNERRQAEAESRLRTIESQLEDSKYGIAYIDASENATQLNRPVTNTLVETVVSLTESLHAQLGLTPSIFAGTATQEEMMLYNNRTILPIVTALTDAMVGSFLTRTAIRQGQRVRGFPDLFKMAPLSEFAEASDALTRNEIMTANEIRAEIGLEPSTDPSADELRNKNLNQSTEETPPESPAEEAEDKEIIDD